MDEDMKDFFKFGGALFLMLAIFFGVMFLIGNAWEESACEYVCTANGDENAHQWNTSCWCRDGKGLYNPKDGRGDRP